jgi:proline iminopeptidase
MRTKNPNTVAAPLTSEGRLEVERGFEIAYRVYGSGSRTLVGLHGGPGVSSRYLTRLNEVIDDDTQLVLYDQLGGGDSDWPDDPELWQVQRFVDELETVRTRLDLGRITLYGQSWGGMLALAYTLDHRAHVDALILSNTYACGKDYLLDISDHRVSLGREMHAAMLRHEQAGTLDDPEYKDAVAELYARYLYRSSPYDSTRSRAEFEEIATEYMPQTGPAYALWGPHEFMGTGPEAYFDVSDRLHEISIPALVLCGWYDELTPQRCSRPLADDIADSEFVVLGQSSHLTIFESESEPYLAVIRDFLERHPQPATAPGG